MTQCAQLGSAAALVAQASWLQTSMHVSKQCTVFGKQTLLLGISEKLMHPSCQPVSQLASNNAAEAQASSVSRHLICNETLD